MKKTNYVRYLLESANIKVNDDIITQIAEETDIPFVEIDEIGHLISFDEIRGFTFCNDPITSIKKLNPSSDLFPKSSPCTTTEDNNYYILTTMNATYVTNIDDISISGVKQIKKEYLVYCPKIAGYRIVKKELDEVVIVVYTDDFKMYDNRQKREDSSTITLNIRIEDAAADLSSVLENIESTLIKKLTTKLGSLGNSSMRCIDSILSDTRATLVHQVDNFNNMDSECLN